MSRGPLPTANPRRRNAKTYATTILPRDGREGPPPKCPASYKLRKAGKAWWKWAWSTPQAAAWDVGSVYLVARRAQLEDDRVQLDHPIEAKDLAELLGVEENEWIKELEAIVGRLAATAGGRAVVLREMRELDKVLGLTPKALAELRWSIEEPGEQDDSVADSEHAPATVSRLRAV